MCRVQIPAEIFAFAQIQLEKYENVSFPAIYGLIDF